MNTESVLQIRYSLNGKMADWLQTSHIKMMTPKTVPTQIYWIENFDLQLKNKSFIFESSRCIFT